MESRLERLKSSFSEISIEKAFLILSLFVTTGLVLLFAVGSSVIFNFFVGNVFKERLQVAQDLFTQSISQDLITGSNHEIYRKCKMFFSEPDVASVKVSNSNTDEVCVLNKAANNTLSMLSNTYFDDKKLNIAGTIIVEYSLDKLYSVHLRILLTIFFLFIVFLGLQVVILRKIGRKVTQPIRTLSDKLIHGNLEDFTGRIKKTKITELDILSEGLRTLSINALEHQKSKILQAEGEAAIHVAKQVSHDIRSPLSALTMVVGTLKEIPEEKRILIRNATQRINDIANDLLHKGDNNEAGQHLNDSSKTSGNTNENIKLTTEFIPVLIDILTSEKRMQFREYSELEIEVDLKDSFGAFAMVNSNELKRVISNLVNNAVEAFKSHHGRIVVGVKKLSAGNTHQVEISVSDNGKGIPKHILEKLGQMGVSHGKEGTQSGSGLGVYHAKKTAESFGGNFEIDSTEGQGTTIRIILPLAVSPNWFANKIDLTGKKYLVSLDDDISIHQIWAGRLVSLGLSDIEHLRFQSGETFKQYVNSNMNKLKASLFLVDYELLNQPLTGLDIIDELGIEKYSVLVTSRYEEISIQERANRLRLSILPKALAGFVPFETQQTKEEHAGAAVLNPTNTNPAGSTNEEKVLYDLCLIDDDIQLIHPVWAFVAESKGLKIKMFSTPQAFFAVADSIDQRTPIYVDVSLGDGIKGTDVAQQIHKLGFSEICLATGYSADSIEVPSFIRRVVGKDFPG